MTENEVRLGTLFDMAKANGWIPPVERPPEPPLEAYAADVGSGMSKPGQPNIAPGKTFELVSIKKLIDNPRPIEWTVRNYLQRGGMGVIIGAYGTGKSFLAYDLAFCIAAGITWRGNAVTQDSVVILAGEGHSGIAHRFHALEIFYEKPCPENLYISTAPGRLTDFPNACWVADAVNNVCGTAGVVVIDTVNRNFGGLDESSTKDMTLFVNNLDAVFRATGKTIILIHHTGHNETHRGRGNSVLPASCEGEFLVTGHDGGLALTCVRQKEAEKSKPLYFKFAKIELPGLVDDQNQPVSSLVLELDTDGRPEAALDLTQRDRDMLAALAAAIKAHGQEVMDGTMGDLFPFMGVELEKWRIQAYELPFMVELKPDSRRKTFTRNFEKLLKLGIIKEISGLYYPTPSGTSGTGRDNE